MLLQHWQPAELSRASGKGGLDFFAPMSREELDGIKPMFVDRGFPTYYGSLFNLKPLPVLRPLVVRATHDDRHYRGGLPR
jgi:hypothetical protein